MKAVPTPTARQRRLWELSSLRARIDEEYARLEAEIEAERLALITALAKAKEPTCGTESGYKRHSRRGEPSCDACKEARRIGEARRAAARRERMRSEAS